MLHCIVHIAGVLLAAVDIFEALEAGVDVFDGSYPTELHTLNAANQPCSCCAACPLCVLSAFTFTMGASMQQCTLTTQ